MHTITVNARSIERPNILPGADVRVVLACSSWETGYDRVRDIAWLTSDARAVQLEGAHPDSDPSTIALWLPQLWAEIEQGDQDAHARVAAFLATSDGVPRVIDVPLPGM